MPVRERSGEERRPITTGSAAYKESLRNIILRILAERPSHGYDIIKKIEEITDGRWRPAAGTIYPLLETMKEEGLIEVISIEKGGVRGGKRVIYGLTKKGWEELAKIILQKAQGKMKFVEWMIVRGAVLLREHGLDDMAAEICRYIKESCECLMESISEHCGLSGGRGA